jgi:lysophospholipase L1-like esterase
MRMLVPMGLLVVVLAGCSEPHVMAIGSSITCGTACQEELRCNHCFGYPDYLKGIIRAHVSNRGAAGWTTTWYLNGPGVLPNGWPFRFWRGQPSRPPKPKASLLTNVILGSDTDSEHAPSVVLLMIGINNEFWASQGEIAAGAPDTAFAEYQQLVEQARALVPHVFVLTELCGKEIPCKPHADGCCELNNRDSFAYVTGYNELIRAAYPDDYIPMDAEFAARIGISGIANVGPGKVWLHPNCEGYTMMAEIVADYLVERGLVRRRIFWREAACES